MGSEMCIRDRNLPCQSQDASSTTCRSGSAAGVRHIGIHPRTDLGLMGTIIIARMLSIALLACMHSIAARSHNTPTAGAASSLHEEALGFDSPVVDSRATTSSVASEGARQPRQPELGAQRGPSGHDRSVLTVASSPRRCQRGARDGRQQHRPDALPPRPRRGRDRHHPRPRGCALEPPHAVSAWRRHCACSVLCLLYTSPSPRDS